MLYDKNIRKICAFCFFGQDFSQDAILCSKCGPVSPEHHCRRFKYDPLRRRPAAPAALKTDFSKADFDLNAE
ncbi:MAG: hypothetical protein IJU78_06775 [Clostridia bacterium]|nr:hypothetical protein [Clostridia bacterium]